MNLKIQREMARRVDQGKKALRLLRRPLWRHGMVHGVAAAIEHAFLARIVPVNTVIDVGANIGQFSLLALEAWPGSTVYAFEALPAPAARYRKVLGHRPDVILHQVALGCRHGHAEMHVSARVDSSSLLPIGLKQRELFPGTAEERVTRVEVAPLDSFSPAMKLTPPILLKIDVQGYELEVLKGCEAMLALVSSVYVECSEIELYEGQPLRDDVDAFLRVRDFLPEGGFNEQRDGKGQLVQSDRLYRRRSAGASSRCGSSLLVDVEDTLASRTFASA